MDAPSGTLAWTQITVPNGQQFRGELVHVYDMRISDLPCATACEDLVYAVFDPRRYTAAEATDESITTVCVDPDDPGYLIEEVVAEPGLETFVEFRRRHRFSFNRLPLDGVWFVENGNNQHGHEREGGAGDYAWDFLMLRDSATGLDPAFEQHCQSGASGCSAGGQCTNGDSNHDYYAWQRCLRAPSPGRVLLTERAQADICPRSQPASSNYIVYQLGGGYRIMMTHIAEDTLVTSAGDELATGDAIAVVGNSGYTLTPHVHATLFWHGKDVLPNCQGGWSIPSEFEALYVKDAGTPATTPADRVELAIPKRGQFVSNDAFSENTNSPVRGCE